MHLLQPESTCADAASAEILEHPLTVIHAVPGAWLEQTQTWLHEQIRSLPGHVENHIVCPCRRNLDQFSLPNIHAEDAQPVLTRWLDRTARMLGQRQHPRLLSDVVVRTNARVLHSHFGSTAWANLAVARDHDLRHVVTFYGLDVNYLPQHGWLTRYRELFELVDLVLCEGPHMAASIVRLGCRPEKVRVHHLGVDLDRIEFRPCEWNVGAPLRFLIAASFREKKGIPYAIEALGRIGEDLPVEVTIIGDAADSSGGRTEKRRIHEAISTQGLDSRVRMLGFQPHAMLIEEAQRHHVFLSPSITATNGDTEGGAPVSLIDMLATGLNVVSTRHCDIPEIIAHGATGWLAEERDVEGLIQCILYMIEAKAHWPAMHRRGRAHVEREFNSRIQARRLAEHYQSVAEARDG